MGLLVDLCTTVLVAVSQYVADADLEPFNEMYVTPGKPSFECCGACIVWVVDYGQSRGSLPQPGSTQRIVNAAVKTATLQVDVLDCVPTQDDQGKPPSLEAYAEAAQRIYDRAEVIYTGLFCDVVKRTLWEGTVVGQATGETSLTQFRWDSPSGGCLAGHCTIITQLQG